MYKFLIDSDDEKKINFYKYVNNAWVSDGSHIVDGEEYSAFNVFNDNGKLYYTFNRGLYEGDDALFEFTMVDADTNQELYISVQKSVMDQIDLNTVFLKMVISLLLLEQKVTNLLSLILV